MKNYRITVNGKTYDVTVEETDGVSSPVQEQVTPSQPSAPQPKQAAPVAPAAGKANVSAPMCLNY